MTKYDDLTYIDKNNLDDECCILPALFDYWSERECEFREEVDIAKDKLEVVKAQVDLYYRSMSLKDIEEKRGQSITSKTESAIKSLIVDDDRVKAAHDHYHEVRKKHRVFTRLLKRIEVKKWGLDNLVKLHGQGYFSEIKGGVKERSIIAMKKRLADEIKRDSEKNESKWSKKVKRIRKRKEKRS